MPYKYTIFLSNCILALKFLFLYFPLFQNLIIGTAPITYISLIRETFCFNPYYIATPKNLNALHNVPKCLI